MAPSARHEAVLSDRATGHSAPDRLRTLRTCRKRRAQRIHFRDFAARSPKPLVLSMVTIVKARRRTPDEAQPDARGRGLFDGVLGWLSWLFVLALAAARVAMQAEPPVHKCR